MPTPDDDLLTAAVAGDDDSLSQLLKRHGPKVRRSLEGKIDRKWRHALTEDDVMQETYLESFLEIRQFEPRGIDSFVAWLRRLAQHNLIDAVRELQAAKKGGDKNRVSVAKSNSDESYVELFEKLGGTTTTPSRVAMQNEARQALDEAFHRLPEAYRLVVSLYDLGGCSAEDVAEACDCSVGAMFMRRARAHSRLQELLGSQSRI